MPDRVLPEHIRRRLSEALDQGAPLIAPLPSQARFATPRGAMPSPRWRLRALTVAVAAAGIVVVAFAGPPQTREWVVQSVNGLSKQVGIPAGSVTPSPKEPATSGQTNHTAPAESPENHEASPEPAGSPEPAESPDGNDGSQSGPAQPQPSPTPQPSDGGGGGGGDHSPEPSPSSGN